MISRILEEFFGFFYIANMNLVLYENFLRIDVPGTLYPEKFKRDSPSYLRLNKFYKL